MLALPRAAPCAARGGAWRPQPFGGLGGVRLGTYGQGGESVFRFDGGSADHPTQPERPAKLHKGHRRSRPRRGPKFANTQTTFEGTKMNWVIILARGVVGVDILPQTWELGAAGMAVVVERLKGRLRDMLGARAVLPTVLMSDRGTGMYAPSGHVTRAYDCAAHRCGFKLFWGADAKQQAPDMPDLLLHETAVSWLRGVLRKTKPVVPPWRESPAQWSRRMMDAVAVVNDGTKDVDGLCMQFVDRLEECLAKRGARLSY